MNYASLAFVFAVMREIKCVPLLNLKTLDNMQNSSTILETLNTFDVLNAIHFMCGKNESKKGTNEFIYYCRQLIEENGTYSPLEHIIETKINEIRSSLVKLFNLENKAIVCRGMRHLLPIIMYGICIDNTMYGSTGNGNSYGTGTFDELFKNKSGFRNGENSSFEKKLQQIKASTMKNDGMNEKLDQRPAEQIKGRFGETSSSFMENIATTVLLILPFIGSLDCFHNLYKINKVMTADKSESKLLLLLIFDEVKSMYRTECSADVNSLLQDKDGRWEFECNHDSIPLLVGEIDRLSVAVRKDLQSLFLKFISATDPKRPLHQCRDVSIVFYHTFNKYHDPEVWRLIGNEAIVDHSSDSGKPEATSIDEIASNLSKKIQGTTDGITAEITKKVKCRCYAHLNLLMKLYYCSMRVLAVNAPEVRRSTQAMQRIERDRVYSSLHDEIKGLWTDECFIGDDVGAIDELLDRDGGDKYFRRAYAVYWNRNARSVGKAIETVSNYSSDLGFVAEFGPMLQEIDRIQVQPETEMKHVGSLVDRYKWGEREYKDHCSYPGAEYDDNVSTFSNNMKRASQVTNDNASTRLTLGWMMTMTDILNDDLEDDLEIINNKFP